MTNICSYVHSDPHPGNILVHKNKNGGTDLVLLDHGLYAVSLDNLSSLRALSNSILFRLSQTASATNTHNSG